MGRHEHNFAFVSLTAKEIRSSEISNERYEKAKWEPAKDDRSPLALQAVIAGGQPVVKYSALQ